MALIESLRLRALAMLSPCLSKHGASRSACPTAPITASVNLPVAVLVSSGWPPDMDSHPEADLLGFEPGDNLQQVAERPRQPCPAWSR